MNKLILGPLLVTLCLTFSCTENDEIRPNFCEKTKSKLDSIQNLYKTKFPIQGYDNPYYIKVREIQLEYLNQGCDKTNIIFY